jgi:hypothetical protein
MSGLVPGIHAKPRNEKPKNMRELRRVDGRDKPGHDDIRLKVRGKFPFLWASCFNRTAVPCGRTWREAPDKGA